MSNVFRYILLAFSVLLNNAIKMSIDFLKHMGDPGINYGLPTLENSLANSGKIYSSLEDYMMKMYSMEQHQ